MKRLQDNWGSILLFLFIVLLAAAIRFYRLESFPGWYSDEGTLIVLGQSLRFGEWNYLGIKDSPLIVGRPPLFILLLGLLYRIFPDDILTLRVISVLSGVITTGLLILLPDRFIKHGDRRFGFTAGVLYATLPFAIFYNRLGFSYNLLAPFLVLIFFTLLRYYWTSETSWLLLACGLASIGFLIDLWMFVIFPICFVLPLLKRKTDIVKALITLGAPISLYFAFMLIRMPESFLFDLEFTYGRVSPGFIDQAALIIANYAVLLHTHLWFGLSLVGFLFFSDRGLRLFASFFVLTMFVLTSRSVFMVGLGNYQFLPMVPILVLGLARFVLEIFDRIYQEVIELARSARLFVRARTRVINFVTGSLVFLFFGFTWLFGSIATVLTYPAATQDVLDVLIDPEGAAIAAEFVNSRVRPNDVVLASPALAWMIDSNVSDFQVSLAYDGHTSHHLPDDIPQSRFSFDPSIDNVRFVVVDSIWDNWAKGSVPDYGILTDEFEDWDLVFEMGEYRIYQAPDD